MLFIRLPIWYIIISCHIIITSITLQTIYICMYVCMYYIYTVYIYICIICIYNYIYIFDYQYHIIICVYMYIALYSYRLLCIYIICITVLCITHHLSWLHCYPIYPSFVRGNPSQLHRTWTSWKSPAKVSKSRAGGISSNLRGDGWRV
jgi:hypothetical protein